MQVVAAAALLLVLKPGGAEVPVQTSCSAVTSLYSTSVTCRFGEHIGQSGFNVRFFFPDPSSESEITLACDTDESEGWKCYKATGVTFDETHSVGDNLTITRPPSIPQVGGQYRCQAVEQTYSVQDCRLSYDGNAVSPSDESSVTQQANCDTLLWVNVILVVLTIAALLIVCLVLFLKPDSFTRRLIKPIFGGLWPGAIGDPREKFPDRNKCDGQSAKILPAYFYNLGRKAAFQDKEDPKKDVSNSKTTDRPPDREPNLTEEATPDQPLLLPESPSEPPPGGQDTRHGQGPGGRDTRHGQGPGGRDTRHGQGPGGRDTRYGQGPDREEHPMTNVTSAPPVPHQAVESAATSFTTEQKLPDSSHVATPSTEDEDWCDVRAGPSSAQLEHVEASIPLLTGGPGHSASSEEHGPGGESKQQRSDKGSKKGHENADKKAMKEKQEAEKKAKKEREEAEKKAKKEREEAEKKAKKEREEAEKKAKKEKDKAEKKAKDGEQKK
ncbi:uncharacterized protein LOC143291720 isoform X2 [Babylonia areolata]|uniref:uncharacterized protein LOC143291720 isoform X2 n=1 Tax=Babylonia areolata TaxID=304850 RepID=UPI003FD5B746